MHTATFYFDDPLIDRSWRLDLQVEYLWARLVADFKSVSESLADQKRHFIAFSL